MPCRPSLYGQTLGVAFACLIRSSCACARVGARLAPTLARLPNAVPVKALPDVLRKSRRDRSMTIPYGNGQVRLTIELSDGPFESPVATPPVFPARMRKSALHSTRGINVSTIDAGRWSSTGWEAAKPPAKSMTIMAAGRTRSRPRREAPSPGAAALGAVRSRTSIAPAVCCFARKMRRRSWGVSRPMRFGWSGVMRRYGAFAKAPCIDEGALRSWNSARTRSTGRRGAALSRSETGTAP